MRSNANQATVTDHLLPLCHGWQLWRWACLRAAGFPATHVLALAAPRTAAAVDLWITREQTRREAKRRALAACQTALEVTVGEARREVVRALKALRAGTPPMPCRFEGLDEVLEAYQLTHAALEEQRRALDELLREERTKTSAIVRDVARDPLFREAILWQNPNALHNGVDSLLRQPMGATDSKTRQHEWIVAGYLQRYCTKNDTIGFFGPVGWATFVDHSNAVRVEPGTELLAKRTVYFEFWCIDALAQTIVEDPRIWPDLVPRRMPTVWLEGETLHHPIDQTTRLPTIYARLLTACDGERTARMVAREFVADATLELSSEEDVYDLLSELVEQKLATWTLEVPPTASCPEEIIRETIERVEDAPARERASEMLRDLEAGRDRVAAAAGDATRLAVAMGELNKTFTRLTGQDGKRSAGTSYAGRTLVFEDCRRAGSVELGTSFCDRLGPPLALLLQSARWYTYTVATRYLEALVGIYRRLCRETGSSIIDYIRYWEHARALFPGVDGETPSRSIVCDVVAELQARWSRLLRLSPERAREERRVSELDDGVAAMFAAPHPGWPNARHCSPDVMIAARGPNNLTGGDYLIVIGEMHAGFNTLNAPFLIKEHPDPEAIVRMREADLPEPCVAQVWTKARSRADFYSLSGHDLDIENGQTRSSRLRAQVLAVASLVVKEEDRQLLVCSRDGRRRINIIAFLEQHLIAESYAHFRWLLPLSHTPRVTIEGVVFSREAWHLSPTDIPFAHVRDPNARFIGAQCWKRQHGLPRFAFVKVPEETKPCFVDFDSPIYLDLFARQVRKASAVTISEMLPAFDECWLTDMQGHVYTSELRLAITDPVPWVALQVPCTTEIIDSQASRSCAS
jgi:lantibiotic biosynthesis dehydratase-like protein